MADSASFSCSSFKPEGNYTGNECCGQKEKYNYMIPIKRIKTMDDIATFCKSSAYNEIIDFIISMSKSIEGQTCRCISKSPPEIIQKLVNIFDTLSLWVEQFPPSQQAMRYGNKSFQSWWDKLNEESENLLKDAFSIEYENAIKELNVYFIESFGNRSRIDYGSGHEYSFLCFLFCLFKLGILKPENKRDAVLLVFKKYLDLMRILQKCYFLEPAGSRGVWGLDDYHFLPFLWGAAQLQMQSDIPPSKATDPLIAAEYCDEYMYIDAIKFILDTKKNVSFGECSPVLNDITAVPTWKKINSGLLKMYQAEVLQKLPVAQHFYFGSIISFP